MEHTFDLLRSRMEHLFEKIAEEKENITVDGVPGYNAKAQFTNGKVICESAYVICELLPPEKKEDGLCQLRQVIRFTSRMLFETWGILYALQGIYRLRQHGLLDRAADEQDLETLKKALDWRTFVDTENDFALIRKPTNYYGVAFGIARYRELLGWEPVRYSQVLLSHLLDHISRYSGEYGFMDETRGSGRYDRYSILIPAEITELVLSTGWEEPELIRSMLNCSAHICLHMACKAGTGFSYGRSIGAYGDTAALQILSTAAALGGIFSPEEETLARGYCCALVHSMVHFWYDEDMQSINMWEKGRRTDGYRNKNRILGENLSLFNQIIVAEEQWRRIGLTLEKEPEGWEKLAEKQPRFSLTRFTELPLPRSLALLRDGSRVWSLPVINGGDEYADRDPYLPVPRSNFLLEAVPDETHGAWLPCLEMKDGPLLLPAGFASETRMEEDGSVCRVFIRQKGLLIAGKRPVMTDDRAGIETVYTFAPGSVTREDTLTLENDLLENTACVRLQCEMLGGSVEAEGYGPVEDAWHLTACADTPHGRCTQVLRFTRRDLPENGTLRLKWTFRY